MMHGDTPNYANNNTHVFLPLTLPLVNFKEALQTF